jgi:methyltransferase
VGWEGGGSALRARGGLSSQHLFLLLLAAVALERLGELVVSRRHERALVSRGAVEAGAGHYPLMVAVHAAMLGGAAVEVVRLDRPFLPGLGWPMLAVVGCTMALRYWVVATLGERWTTRVLVVPGEPLIGGGPFRFLRHPNYLAVALEVVALPLVHTAWVTAAVCGVANLVVLALRIRVENAALAGAAGAGTSAPAPVRHFGRDEVTAAFARGGVLLDGEGRRFAVHAGRRDGPGEVEVHAEATDIFYVTSGAATLITGGLVVGATVVAPGEVRGASIAGGTPRALASGDVIVIPAGTPHWFARVEAPLSYFVVKSW